MRTSSNDKYAAAIRLAKKNYFLDLLAPYISDGVFDTKRLAIANPKLYTEVRLAFHGVRAACAELGLYPSVAAKKRTEKEVEASGA